MSRQLRRAHQRDVAKKLVNATSTAAYLKRMEELGLLRRKTKFEKFAEKVVRFFGFGKQRA